MLYTPLHPHPPPPTWKLQLAVWGSRDREISVTSVSRQSDAGIASARGLVGLSADRSDVPAVRLMRLEAVRLILSGLPLICVTSCRFSLPARRAAIRGMLLGASCCS